MILLKRNNQLDPWFSVHGLYIKQGEIVKLDGITDIGSGEEYPAEVYVKRNKSTGDSSYPYKASLNCFDYVKGDSHG